MSLKTMRLKSGCILLGLFFVSLLMSCGGGGSGSGSGSSGQDSTDKSGAYYTITANSMTEAVDQINAQFPSTISTNDINELKSYNLSQNSLNITVNAVNTIFDGSWGFYFNPTGSYCFSRDTKYSGKCSAFNFSTTTPLGINKFINTPATSAGSGLFEAYDYTTGLKSEGYFKAYTAFKKPDSTSVPTKVPFSILLVGDVYSAGSYKYSQAISYIGYIYVSNNKIACSQIGNSSLGPIAVVRYKQNIIKTTSPAIPTGLERDWVDQILVASSSVSAAPTSCSSSDSTSNSSGTSTAGTGTTSSSSRIGTFEVTTDMYADTSATCKVSSSLTMHSVCTQTSTDGCSITSTCTVTANGITLPASTNTANACTSTTGTTTASDPCGGQLQTSTTTNGNTTTTTYTLSGAKYMVVTTVKK